MSRGISITLLVLGLLLVVAALVLRLAVYPSVQKAPLDADNVTPSEGVAAALLDTTTGQTAEGVPLTATRTTVGDEAAGDGSVAVYDSTIVVETPDGNALSETPARYAFDRTTSEMVDCCDTSLRGEPIEDFSGIMPLKFPFDTEQRAYPYFDQTLGAAFPAEYDGEEQIDGLNVYRFVQSVAAAQIGTVTLPGALVGAPVPSVDAGRFYANTRTIWVEPTTGIIIKGQEDQLQTLRVTGQDADVATVLEATLTFTDDYVAAEVQDAKDAKGQLQLIGVTLPLVAGILGALLLLIAAIGIIRRPSESDTPA